MPVYASLIQAIRAIHHHTVMELHYFNPYQEIIHTSNRLPHWEQAGVPCTVTFRLADSLPKSLLDSWAEERAIWKKLNPEPWSAKTQTEYNQRFGGTVNDWLDRGHGSCLLREAENRQPIAEVFQHFDEDRYVMVAFVVMPNHVHAVFVLNQKWPLHKVVHSWKSWSSSQIKKRISGHEGSVWQKDYHDRLIRDDRHFRNAVLYIRRNPSRARLRNGEFLLWESDLARRIE